MFDDFDLTVTCEEFYNEELYWEELLEWYNETSN